MKIRRQPTSRTHGLRSTEKGYEAIGRIDPAHAVLAERLARELGLDAFRQTLATLTRLSEAFDAVAPTT